MKVKCPNAVIYRGNSRINKEIEMYETHDKKALLLPNVTPADAGKVLAIDENGKLSLEEMGSGLPEVSSSDAGRVLTVSDDGEWEAASPSGGGLTLYGPYSFTNSESVTLNSDNITSVNLDIILGSGFSTQYILSNEDFPIKIMPVAFNAGNNFAVLNGMFMPDLYENSIVPPYLNVYYFGDSLNNIIYDNGASITFYTDKPLSVYTPEG